ALGRVARIPGIGNAGPIIPGERRLEATGLHLEEREEAGRRRVGGTAPYFLRDTTCVGRAARAIRGKRSGNRSVVPPPHTPSPLRFHGYFMIQRAGTTRPGALSGRHQRSLAQGRVAMKTTRRAVVMMLLRLDPNVTRAHRVRRLH